MLRDHNGDAPQSDVRVKVLATGLSSDPDVVVACGKPQFEDNVFDTLFNPKVLFEVLSDSIEACDCDRGAQARICRRIPSLEEYVLVSQTDPDGASVLRPPDGA